MKKIFAISLIAMTAVTSARADIASQAYVDKQTGTLTNLTTEAKTNLVAAINEVKASAGGDVTALDSRLDTLEGAASVEGSVAEKIATALQAYTTTGADTTYAKQSDFATLQSAVNNETTGLAKTNELAVAALPSTTAASTYQTLANISTNMTTDTGSDTKYPSVKAVETAIGTVNSAASGLDTRLTAAEGKITTAEGDINALEALVGDTAVATQISTATSDMETQTHAAATYQTLDNLATSTSWTTDKSSDTKYASAKAVDAAITAAGYDDTALAARVSANETAIEGLGDLATKDTIANADVASDAAIAMSKIAMPLTTGTDGTYVLTGTISGDTITYKWENIARGN